MLVGAPESELWISHIDRRRLEAVDIQLIGAASDVQQGSIRVFAPDEPEARSRLLAAPDQPLRPIDKSPATRTGWIRRDDLFDTAADWLHKQALVAPVQWHLLCEAGYQGLGDPVLARRPHIIHGGRPFLSASLAAISVSQIGTILRWGRSYRFLGVVVRGLRSIHEGYRPTCDGLFLCDAFDGDSLIVAELRCNESRVSVE